MPIINGTIISGVNAKEATATSADILQGKTAVVGKELITGTMKDNSGKLVTGTFDSGGANFIKGKIAEGGYYDASSILQIPVSNLVSGNIRNGVNIGGVVGSFSGNTVYVGNPMPTSNATQCLYLRQATYTPVTVSTPYEKYIVFTTAGSKICIAKISGISLTHSWTWDLRYGQTSSKGGGISSGGCSKQSDGSYRFAENDGTGGYVAFTINSYSSITFIQSTTLMPVIFNA